jgi:hypothetical protein
MREKIKGVDGGRKARIRKATTQERAAEEKALRAILFDVALPIGIREPSCHLFLAPAGIADVAVQIQIALEMLKVAHRKAAGV